MTIFYIRRQRKYLQKKIDDTHVSDHHPIKLKLIRTLKRKKVELNQQTRTRWDKMDTPKYESKVNTKISKLKNDSINENYSLTQTIEKTMEILNDSAKQCSNQRKYGKNKLKLNIWNNDIKIAIKQNKLVHKQWKEAGKTKASRTSTPLA